MDDNNFIVVNIHRNRGDGIWRLRRQGGLILRALGTGRGSLRRLNLNLLKVLLRKKTGGKSHIIPLQADPTNTTHPPISQASIECSVAKEASPFLSLVKEQDTTRQRIIKEIQDLTGRKLIAYVAALDAPFANVIDHNDIPVIHDFLHYLDYPKRLDILLHSPGGTAEATEKIVYMLRDKVKSLRVIIPETAKSAATLLSLASDEILISYMGELGPIDPQIPVGYDSATRKPIYRPAWSIKHSLDNLEAMLESGRNRDIVGGLLAKIDPLLLDVADKAIRYSQTLAKEWLIQYMRLPEKKAEELSEYLTDLGTQLSHGRVINYKIGIEKGLRITKIDEKSELWSKIWEYHLRATKTALLPPKTKVIDCEGYSMFTEVAMKL